MAEQIIDACNGTQTFKVNQKRTRELLIDKYSYLESQA